MKKTYIKKEKLVDKKYDFLKSEYIDTQREYAFHTKLFYNYDVLYSIYFALYIIAIAVLYYFVFKEHLSVQSGILSITMEKALTATIVLFSGMSYVFIISTYLDNINNIIISKLRMLMVAKFMNDFLNIDIFEWENEYIKTIQLQKTSSENISTNTFFFKILYVLILYCIVEISLVVLCFYTFKINWFSLAFTIIICISTVGILYYWYKIWYILPNYYKENLKKKNNNIY